MSWRLYDENRSNSSAISRTASRAAKRHGSWRRPWYTRLRCAEKAGSSSWGSAIGRRSELNNSGQINSKLSPGQTSRRASTALGRVFATRTTARVPQREDGMATRSGDPVMGGTMATPGARRSDRSRRRSIQRALLLNSTSGTTGLPRRDAKPETAVLLNQIAVLGGPRQRSVDGGVRAFGWAVDSNSSHAHGSGSVHEQFNPRG